MKKNLLLMPVLIGMALVFTASLPVDRGETTLPARDLHPFGRTLATPEGHVELISSAAHVGFHFSGTTCQVYAYVHGTGHNYLQYEIDGVYQKRLRVEGNVRTPLTITTTGNGPHLVWIYKATEAHTGPVFIEKITGKGLVAVKRQQAPLIEFIGNSITCGAAADPSEVACGAGVYHDQHNAYQAYGPRTARALQANYIVSSVSGIGIYRNWNSDGPTMPQVYEQADFQLNGGRPWSFNRYQPDVVSIALGTNDFSRGDGKRARLPFDSATYVQEYIRFVDLVKSKYGDVQIVLLSSAMLRDKARALLQNCLTAVQQQVNGNHPQHKPIQTFFFQPMVAKGCTGHPNVEDHAVLAQELTPFMQRWLKK